MPAWRDERHGPLPILLLALTFVTGLVDALSFFALGRVFVANMTGNVVFLGFGLSGVAGFSIAASLTAMAAFLSGALAGGRLATRFGSHRGRLLAIGVATELGFLVLALLMAIAAGNADSIRYALIVAMALAMGVQSATARHLAVPDLTTTVITQTLTALASESTLAGGAPSNQLRRVAAPVAMLVGAALGALLVLGMGISATLAVTCLVVAAICLIAWRLARLSEPWTVGMAHSPG